MGGSTGGDLDLPAEGRRDRVSFVNGKPLTPNQDVTVAGVSGQVKVLGPGRGRDWFLAGWVEGGVLVYGTFSASQVAT